MKNFEYPIYLEYGMAFHKIESEDTYLDVEDNIWETGITLKKKAEPNVDNMLKYGRQISEACFNNHFQNALSKMNQMLFLNGTEPASEEEKRESCQINEPENEMI